MKDRLEQLRLLAAIAERGTLSAAGAALGMSQPSASRCLRLLEGIVGATLVERTAQSSGLTEAGQRFLDAGRGLMDGWDRAIEAARADRDDLAGHLCVVAPVAAGEGLLATMVARFLRRHPDVTIDWTLSDAPVDPTRSGCDLWIRVGEVPTDDLVVRDIWRIDRAIVAASGGTAATHPSDLVQAPAVFVRAFLAREVELIDHTDARFSLRQAPVLTVDSIQAARAALLEGVGYAVMPLWAVQRDLDDGALTRLCPDWTPPSITLSFAYRPGIRPRRVTALRDFIRQELVAESGSGAVFLREIGAEGSVHLVGTSSSNDGP